MRTQTNSHENRFTTKRLKGLLPLLLPGAAVLVMFMVLVVPKVSDLNRTRRNVLNLRQNLQRSTLDTEAFPKGVLEKLLADEEKIHKRIPESKLFLTYLEQVREVAKSLGIPMIVYDKGAPEDFSTAEILARSELGALSAIEEIGPFSLKGIPVRFQFHCSYRKLYTFLRKLREIDRYTDIQELVLKRLPDNLSVELTTKIFYLDREGEAADAA